MRYPFCILLIAYAPAAAAHPGHGGAEAGGGLLSGLAHPVLGADHLLAMVVLGLLAALSGGRALLAMPATFLAAMAAGAALASAGAPIPLIEPLILASVIALGAAVALALRLPLAVSLPAIALFGAAHGAAHGLEAPAAGLPAYAAGFLLATAALHGVGIALGLIVSRVGTVWARLLGGGAAAAGLSTFLLGGA